MQYASSQIAIYFSMLLTAMMIHGYVPKSMRNAVIVPIIKNKNKRSTDKDNYRPICLSNVFSKVVEKVLYSRILINSGLSPSMAPKCVYSFLKS